MMSLIVPPQQRHARPGTTKLNHITARIAQSHQKQPYILPAGGIRGFRKVRNVTGRTHPGPVHPHHQQQHLQLSSSSTNNQQISKRSANSTPLTDPLITTTTTHPMTAVAPNTNTTTTNNSNINVNSPVSSSVNHQISRAGGAPGPTTPEDDTNPYGPYFSMISSTSLQVAEEPHNNTLNNSSRLNDNNSIAIEAGAQSTPASRAVITAQGIRSHSHTVGRPLVLSSLEEALLSTPPTTAASAVAHPPREHNNNRPTQYFSRVDETVARVYTATAENTPYVVPRRYGRTVYHKTRWITQYPVGCGASVTPHDRFDAATRGPLHADAVGRRDKEQRMALQDWKPYRRAGLECRSAEQCELTADKAARLDDHRVYRMFAQNKRYHDNLILTKGKTKLPSL